MAQSTAVKSLTLIGFIILLTSFIAFKSGAFDKYLKAEDKSLPVDTPVSKTEEKVKHSPSMLPTSKSMITVEQHLEFQDTKRVKYSPSMLSTSKSTTVIDQKLKFELVDIDSFLARERKLRAADSLKTDSLKRAESK